MLQVQLFLHAQQLTTLTPMGLMGHTTWNATEPQPFNHKDCFAYTVPELQFQLRVHDFFMGELSTFIVLNTTYVSSRYVIKLGCHHGKFQEWPSCEVLGSQLQLDSGGSAQDRWFVSPPENCCQSLWHPEGVDITTHRLFGPQPRTLAYVCIWEIVVGNVKASLSAHEAKALLAAGNTFRLNFVDLVNSPAAEYLPPADPDGWSKFYIS